MRQAHPVIEAWNRFWFSPTDPTLLGVVRILAGLMLLYTHAVWGLELEAFFGPNGWQSSELVQALQHDQFVFSFWWWVPDGLIHVAHWAALLVLVTFTVGLFAEVTAVLACIVAISYANRAPAALFGLDQINTMLALYLAIGGSGRALSLDRIRLRYRRIRRAVDEGSHRIDLAVPPNVRANLGLRLVQVHMCIIYLFAGLSKLQGTAWWNGEAMWLAFSNLEYQSADMTWLARFPWLINLITHTTVMWEISFCALVWVPSLRPVMLALAVVLHFGIGATLGMWTFGLVMLIGCTSFLTPTMLQRVGRLFQPSDQPAIRVVRYDRDCIGCRREAVVLKVFDVFDRIRLVETNHETATSGESEPARPRNRWLGVATLRHTHRNETQTISGNGKPAAPVEIGDEDVVVPPEPVAGPLIVLVLRRSRQQQLLSEYLSERGFRILEAESVERGIAVARLSPPDCVVLFGKRLDVNELAGFQNQVSEIDDEFTASVILLAPDQRDILSQLRMNGAERVLVQPVSFRTLRIEMESALNHRKVVHRDSARESQAWNQMIAPRA